MLVGAGIVASRHVVAEVPPFTLAMLRCTVGFLCLLPFAIAVLRGPALQVELLLALVAIVIGLGLATRPARAILLPRAG